MECVARPSPQLRCPLCFDPAPVRGGYACPTCNSRLHAACAHEFGPCHADAAGAMLEGPSPHGDESGEAREPSVFLHGCLVWFTGFMGVAAILGHTVNCLPAFLLLHVLGSYAGRLALNGLATGHVENIDLSGKLFFRSRRPVAFALAVTTYLASAVLTHAAALYFVFRSLGLDALA